MLDIDEAAECTVGVIGLGIMGSAVAAHLVESGFPVVGYDLAESACAELVLLGGRTASTPASVAAQTDIVLTLLPADAALDSVLFGVNGVTACKRRLPIVVEMSTFSLAEKQRARDKLRMCGGILLDCPVSGTGVQARRKDIAIYGSGSVEDYARCLPVFRAFSRSQHYLGDFGAGTKMKLIANLLVAVHNVAAAEAVLLAVKAGLDPELMVHVVGDGAGTSRMLEVRGPLMACDDYSEAMMKVSVWEKDMTAIRDFAESHGLRLPLFCVADELYRGAGRLGFGAEDTASVCRVLEQLLGVSRPGKPDSRTSPG